MTSDSQDVLRGARLASVKLVGCGKMGGAMLGGWLQSGMPASSITVVDPWLAAARNDEMTRAFRPQTLI